MHHAEATASDWLELAAEERHLADDPRCTAECREYHERAAMDYEVEAVIQALILAAGRLAGHTGMPLALFCGHVVEAVRRLMAERDTAQRAILDVRIALSGKGILPFSNGFSNGLLGNPSLP
jgi:hypothetical protein